MKRISLTLFFFIVGVSSSIANEELKPFLKDSYEVCDINNKFELNSRDFTIYNDNSNKLNDYLIKLNNLRSCGDYLAPILSHAYFLALPFILHYQLGVGVLGSCALGMANAYLFGHFFSYLGKKGWSLSERIKKYGNDKYGSMIRDLQELVRKQDLFVANWKGAILKENFEDMRLKKRQLIHDLYVHNSYIENKYQVLIEEDLESLKSKIGSILILKRFDFNVRYGHPPTIFLGSTDDLKLFVGRLKKVQNGQLLFEDLDNKNIKQWIRVDEDHINLLYKPHKNSFYMKNLSKFPQMKSLEKQTATLVMTNKKGEIKNTSIYIHSYENFELTYQLTDNDQILKMNIRERRVEFTEDGLLEDLSENVEKEFNGFLGLHVERPDTPSLNRIIDELNTYDDQSYVTLEEMAELKENILEMDRLVLKDIKNSDMPDEQKNDLLEEIIQAREAAKEARLLDFEPDELSQ
ncbi:MAG: hypothetical protein H6621_09965 [Halobacteriovoraceae bacterium]|nr:hypothetical protein [Halobacteriovoraceae bacterium]MCB9095382.1 hypothetical protein [Halobacteriovoraceae bacterium]